MSGYAAEELSELGAFYRTSLLEDTLPFWLPRALDTRHGGYLTMRERDGALLDDDKPVWFQGRFSWLLSTLYRTVEPRPEWLEGAAGRTGPRAPTAPRAARASRRLRYSVSANC